MGTVTSCVYDDVLSQCVNSSESPTSEIQFYKDHTGVTREFLHSGKHVPEDELKFVAARDSFVMKPNDEWYLINVDWLAQWLEFAKGTANIAPGHITNTDLVDGKNPKRLRANITVKRDFRCVCKDVWNHFYERYGGGPVLFFIVPIGYEERSYRTGEWMKAASLADIVLIIYPQTRLVAKNADKKDKLNSQTPGKSLEEPMTQPPSPNENTLPPIPDKLVVQDISEAETPVSGAIAATISQAPEVIAPASTIDLNKPATRISSVIRGFLSRCRFIKAQQCKSQTFLVNLVSAQSVLRANSSDGGSGSSKSSNLYITVSGVSRDVVVSTYRSLQLPLTTAPVSAETALVSGVTGDADLTLALCEEVNDAEVVLGQTVVSLSKIYRRLYRGADVRMSLALHAQPEADGTLSQHITGTSRQQIAFSIACPRRGTSASGWVNIRTEDWALSWATLHNAQLRWFSSLLSLETPVGVIDCKDLTRLSKEERGGVPSIVCEFRDATGDLSELLISFSGTETLGVDSAKALKDWHYKLSVTCSHLPKSV